MFRIVLIVWLACTGCSGSGSEPTADASDGGIEDADGDAGDVSADEDLQCGTERVREDIGIPTLDGHYLSAFVDRPAESDCPLPTILLQTPYDKDKAYETFFGEERPLRPLFNSPHYNYVVVDWRGFHGSGDLPHPGDGAWLAQDAYDTVEWIAAQPWSDKQVGTWGVSALCVAQFRTASGPINNAQHPEFNDEPPPHLTAMVPIMCAMRMAYDQTYPGGVLRHEYAMALDVLGYGVRKVFEDNPRQNFLWDLVDGSIPSQRMRVPALVVSGWWDLVPRHTVAAWEELVDSSDPAVRDQHRLLIGPWIHFAAGGATSQGAIRPLTPIELAYVDTPRKIDIDSLAFFDHHLRRIDNQVSTWAPIRYHHENLGWQSAQAWPPTGTVDRTLYFDDQARLVDAPPTDGSLSLPYDPADPSPSMGGGTLSPYNCVGHASPVGCMLTPDTDNLLLHGPLSQAELTSRQDQLSFATGVLEAPLVLLGKLRVHVDVSTDGADTDLSVRILDIDPSGDPRLIGDGIQRLSARDGPRAFSEVSPGERYTLTIETLKDFAYTLQAGHRLGIMISASNWPLFARNPCDGAVFMGSDTLESTRESFTYGTPPKVVNLKGQAHAVTNTLYLDGVTRLEFETLP